MDYPDNALDLNVECEEWVGWIDLPPKQTVRVTGRIRRVLTREEARALLDEGKRIRAAVEARVDAMERIPEADRVKRCRAT